MAKQTVSLKRISKTDTDPKKRVYINNDNTPKEREMFKKRKEELKNELQRRTQNGERNLAIRGNNIVDLTASHTGNKGEGRPGSGQESRA